MKIAVVLSCYNRKEMTRRCLEQLYEQFKQNSQDEFTIYVFDDGSTDGTVEMIYNNFPEVNLLQGKGCNYWSKSMYMGMCEAIKKEYDLYLMINDDVDFFNDAVKIMLDNYRQSKQACGIVGSTKATKTEECTYGGRDKNQKLILPGKEQECFWANWNCFLIDNQVIKNVGIIDGRYQHAWGDYDYSYRMKKAGIPIYVADKYIGRCDLNSMIGTFRDQNVRKIERLKKMFSPKGMPFNSYMRYHIKTQGKKNIFKYLYGYMSIIGYIFVGKEIR